jgi:hypothetical protein
VVRVAKGPETSFLSVVIVDEGMTVMEERLAGESDAFKPAWCRIPDDLMGDLER